MNNSIMAQSLIQTSFTQNLNNHMNNNVRFNTINTTNNNNPVNFGFNSHPAMPQFGQDGLLPTPPTAPLNPHIFQQQQQQQFNSHQGANSLMGSPMRMPLSRPFAPPNHLMPQSKPSSSSYMMPSGQGLLPLPAQLNHMNENLLNSGLANQQQSGLLPLPPVMQTQAAAKQQPNHIYLNPSFIPKKQSSGSDGQNVLRETNKTSASTQQKHHHDPKEAELTKTATKPNVVGVGQVKQRSRKELELLLESRLAAELMLSNENEKDLNKSPETKQAAVTTATTTTLKRKSVENNSQAKEQDASAHKMAKKSPKTDSTTKTKRTSSSSGRPASVVVPAVSKPAEIESVSSSVMVIDDPEYAKKIEEQKRKREEILRLKEEKRNQRIVELKNKQPTSASASTRNVTTSDGQNKRIVTTTSTPLSQTNNSGAKQQHRLLIQNLSLNTSEKYLINMCNTLNIKDKVNNIIF